MLATVSVLSRIRFFDLVLFKVGRRVTSAVLCVDTGSKLAIDDQ